MRPRNLPSLGPSILLGHRLLSTPFGAKPPWHSFPSSILEGVSSGLPMITWPMSAEQFYNEKLLIDVLKIGVGVGSRKWWNLGEHRSQEMVTREDIGKAVALLMGTSGEAEEMRKRARNMGEAAKRAVSCGGSSHMNLVSLVNDLQTMKLSRESNSHMVL